MGHSFLLLAASLMTGQVQDIRPVAHAHTTGSCVSGSCGTATLASCGNECDTGCGSRGPSLLERLRSKFASCGSSTCDTCAPVKVHAKTSCSSGCNDCSNGNNVTVFAKIRERLQGMFNCGEGCGCSTCDSCGSTGGCANGSCGQGGHPQSFPGTTDLKKMPSKVSMSEPPLAEPRQGFAVADHLQQTSFLGTTAQAKVKNPVRSQFAQRVGHEEDYSWITGQLAQVNGRWVVQYASPETVDRFGGNLPLHTTQDMKSYQSGDLVNVHGSVMNQGNNQGLIYRATKIHLVERAR